MHDEGVAHQLVQLYKDLVLIKLMCVIFRDCAAPNIMMDGRQLYPKGFHPSAQSMLPNGEAPASHILRYHAPPVKYYFIDFDISVRFDKTSAEPRLTSGFYGHEKEAPELHIPKPYDPFALDVFILGKVFQKSFLDVRGPFRRLFFVEV